VIVALNYYCCGLEVDSDQMANCYFRNPFPVIDEPISIGLEFIVAGVTQLYIVSFMP
jgi:hypothetical protein